MPKNRHTIGKITPPSHHKKAAEPILIGCLGGGMCQRYVSNITNFYPPHSLIHSVTLCPMRSLKATLKVL